jgi:hypothetical protein
MKKEMTTNKKTFTSPQVIQAVTLCLETDLLQGPSSLGSLQATGHEVTETNAFVESPWD